MGAVEIGMVECVKPARKLFEEGERYSYLVAYDENGELVYRVYVRNFSVETPYAFTKKKFESHFNPTFSAKMSQVRKKKLKKRKH